MLRNFIVSSPCFEFGVALRTGNQLPKSVKRPARKARPLLARRTTPFEIDSSNDLFSGRDAKLLLPPDAHVAKALGASLGPKCSSLQSVRCATYPRRAYRTKAGSFVLGNASVRRSHFNRLKRSQASTTVVQ